MKKVLSILAIGAVVLGMAVSMSSCGGNEGNNPELKNFKVQVKELTSTSVTLEIEALIPDKYFCFDFVTEEAFKKNGADFYFKKFINQIEENNMKPEDLFSKNKISVPYQIEHGKKYVLCLFYVNDDLELDGAIEYTVIDTKLELPDKFVKCIFDDSNFSANGQLDFYLFPNPEWYIDFELGAIWHDGDGAWLQVAIYPESRNAFLGTFTTEENMVAVRSEILNGDVFIDHSYSKEGGTVTISQNADKTFNFDFDLSFDELPTYVGTVSNIKVEGFK